MGGTSTSTSLKSQLVQVVIPPQHDTFVELKRFGEPFRISYVLPTSLHTLHDASEEIGPPAGFSSIHSLILDKV